MTRNFRITKVTFYHGAFEKLRRDPVVSAELLKRGEAIADEATAKAITPSGMEKAEYFADLGVTKTKGSKRTRVGIYAGNFAAMHSEAHNRTLTQALDAGRD